MMRMNPTRFLLYTFVGIWPWAFGIALMGDVISQYLAEALPFLVGGLLLMAIVPGIRLLWRKGPSGERTNPAIAQ